MGNATSKFFKCINCFKKSDENQYDDFAQGQTNIVFPEYKSISDAFLVDVEKNNNLFYFIPLIDFVNLLENFTIRNDTNPTEIKRKTNYKSTDKFLEEEISREEFQAFITIDILNHKNIYDIAMKNNEKKENFQNIFTIIYDSLLTQLNQHFKNKMSERLKKRHILAIGLLYCLSNNIGKIKFFYDIFNAEDIGFWKCEELDEFLLSLFVIASTGIINARMKIGTINKNFPPLKQEESYALVKYNELNNCQKLLKQFDKEFFDIDQMTYEEFKGRFSASNSCGWIFEPKGIREKLQTISNK